MRKGERGGAGEEGKQRNLGGDRDDDEQGQGMKQGRSRLWDW